MSVSAGSVFPDPKQYGFAGRMASLFIESKLTPIVVAASLLLGLFAVLMLPREEEPQIKVPMIDVMVAMPGASAAEVESRVTRPMEKLLWEIPGVEYLYSTASPGGDMTIVSKAGIAGAILVLIAWLLPGRSSAEHPTPSDPGSGTGPPRERT